MPLSLKLPGANMNSRLESREATIFIGWYTFIIHLLAGFYFLSVYCGTTNTDWVASPIFEYSNQTTNTIALIATIYCFSSMIIASLGLIRGVKSDTRIYYFPWLIFSTLEIFLMIIQVQFLLWRYSYDSDTILLAVVILIFATHYSYLFLVVLSNYKYLTRIQNPTLIFPPEM